MLWNMSPPILSNDVGAQRPSLCWIVCVLVVWSYCLVSILQHNLVMPRKKQLLLEAYNVMSSTNVGETAVMHFTIVVYKIIKKFLYGP